METIKITKQTLQKAINEGVIEALAATNAGSDNNYGENEELRNITFEMSYAADQLSVVSERIKEEIIPDIKSVFKQSLDLVKKIFGEGALLNNIRMYHSGNQIEITIPLSSLDGYKKYLESNGDVLYKILEEYVSDTQGWDAELTKENFEEMKQSFFNDEGWVDSTLDEAFDDEEENIISHDVTPNFMYYYNKQGRGVVLELELPFDIEKYQRFVNGED